MRTLLLLSILLFGCEITPDPKPAPDPTDGGETTDDEDSGQDVVIDTPCGHMCAHFRDLGCEEGKAFYDSDKPGPVDVPNTSCEEFCESQMDLGVDLNVMCATKAPSCDEIETWRAMTTCN